MEEHSPKPRKARTFMVTLAVLFATLALGVVVFWEQIPFTKTAAWQLTRTLESHGLKVKSLKVETLDNSHIGLSDVQLGESPGFKVTKLEVDFSLPQLQDIVLHDVKAQDVWLHVYNSNDRFTVSGLEPLMAPKEEAEQQPLLFDLPALQKLLPTTLQAQRVALSGKDVGWSFDTVLDADVGTQPSPTLKLASKQLTALLGAYKIVAHDVDVSAILDESEKQWDAKLSLKNVITSGIDAPIPPLAITAEAMLREDSVTAKLAAIDPTKTHVANATISLPLDNPQSGTLAIQKLLFPWGSGVISLKPVTIPLTFNKPLALSIELDKVDLAELLALLGEGKVSGTGEISGTLPITYYPDGRVTLQEGNASAIAAGLISVSPSLIPGDNEQVQIARSALENFHYTKLQIRVSSDKDQRSTIHLTLEGTNPELFEGRQINLNVNLTGDVLPLIQQSVLPINNLQQLLKMQDTP